MSQEILDMLARLDELTAEELETLDGLLIAEFDRLDGEPLTPEIAEQMTEVAAAAQRVREQHTAVVEGQEAAEAAAATLRDQMHAVDAPADDAEDKADDEDEDKGDDKVDEAPVAEDKTPEAIAAAAVRRPSIAEMNARRRTGGRSTKDADRDRPSAARGTAEVLAARAWSGVNNGQTVDDWDTAMLGMTEAVNRLGKGTGEDVHVLSVRNSYP